MSAQQLPLGFRLRDDATFASFLPDGNEQVVHAVMKLARGESDNYLYLWGADGSGRSHLLQASCHVASEFQQTAVYLPLNNPKSLAKDLLLGLENINLICLDGVDQIAGDAYWEEQLFHMYNRVRASNNRLIVTASIPPVNLAIKLPDLKSRLSWGTVYHVNNLTDAQKLAALQLRAQSRGLVLGASVGRFLLDRCPRDMGQLFNMLEQLDQASLAAQRRLTIPFVKEVLGV